MFQPIQSVLNKQFFKAPSKIALRPESIYEALLIYVVPLRLL